MKLNCSDCINEWELYGITGRCPGCDNGSRFHPVKRKRAPKKPLTNADLLRAESDEGLADAIFYTLSEFQSKEALLAYLREEVKTDA